jgi:hypothetical protein
VALHAIGRPVSAANAAVACGTMTVQPTTMPGAHLQQRQGKDRTADLRKHPQSQTRLAHTCAIPSSHHNKMLSHTKLATHPATTNS